MAVRVVSCIISAYLFAGSVAIAQIEPNSRLYPGRGDQGVDLRGEIVHDPAVRVDNLFVEVEESGGMGIAARVPVDATGVFVLTGLGPSSYILHVTDAMGNQIMQQIITASSMGYLQIRLPKQSYTRPPSGTVSLFELQHKIPGNALKEAKQADKCLQSQNLKCYIEHIRKAVDLDPDYLRARRNLAVAYLKAGEMDKVLPQAQELVKRNPRSALAYSLSSVAYLERKDFAAAERAARRALSIDSTDENCRYYLAVSLQMQHKDDEEALRLFERVYQRFPKAHLSAADILQRTGRTSAVRDQLRAYLDSPSNAADEKQLKEQVKSWLSSLN